MSRTTMFCALSSMLVVVLSGCGSDAEESAAPSPTSSATSSSAPSSSPAATTSASAPATTAAAAESDPFCEVALGPDLNGTPGTQEYADAAAMLVEVAPAELAEHAEVVKTLAAAQLQFGPGVTGEQLEPVLAEQGLDGVDLIEAAGALSEYVESTC